MIGDGAQKCFQYVLMSTFCNLVSLGLYQEYSLRLRIFYDSQIRSFLEISVFSGVHFRRFVLEYFYPQYYSQFL